MAMMLSRKAIRTLESMVFTSPLKWESSDLMNCSSLGMKSSLVDYRDANTFLRVSECKLQQRGCLCPYRKLKRFSDSG